MSSPYICITGDSHAGASIDTYGGYLDPAYREDFAAWRGAYRNPSKKHLGGKKTKNWDSAERLADLQGDGVVGEVLFPNTVTPFYAKAFHITSPVGPDQYEHALAGTRAHNRWLADFCSEAPERRAGIGLIHLNDLDDAIEDVEWIAEQGLRGGVLLPLASPAEHWLKPLNRPDYDRLWAVIQDCDLVMNQHSGQGAPSYPEAQGSTPLWALEMMFFVQRGFTHLILGGVFERFPKLRYILTESGCSWAIPLMQQMDALYHGWKADYGGSYPYSRENMRLAFSEVPEPEVRMMLGENAAALYGFDLDALRPAADAANITPELVRTPLDEIPAHSQCLAFQRARAERGRAAR
jgi:predicted TIM-barrel fold metal-dependent hydrolase